MLILKTSGRSSSQYPIKEAQPSAHRMRSRSHTVDVIIIFKGGSTSFDYVSASSEDLAGTDALNTAFHDWDTLVLATQQRRSRCSCSSITGTKANSR